MKAILLTSPQGMMARSALSCFARSASSRVFPRTLFVCPSARERIGINSAPSRIQQFSSIPRSRSLTTSTSTRSSPSSDEPHAYLSSSSSDSHILTLTLNRPAQRNAISRQMLSELLTIFRDLPSTHPSARALILRTSSPGTAFCAGADLKERRSMSQQQVVQFLNDLRTAFTALERLPIPSIAALDGLAMGGGMELALCADLRVANEGVKGLGLTETKLGIIPGAGGTQRMTRLLGPARTKNLIYTGRLLTAKDAHDLGLVDYLVPSSAQEQGEQGPAYVKACEIAQEIAKNGPLAIRAAKLAIDKGAAMDSETGLDFERACYNTLLHTKDRLEGLKAFAEKRKPEYKGE